MPVVDVPCQRMPSDFLTDCPIPEMSGDTFGDVVNYSVELIAALKACNAKIRVIKAQEELRCAD